MPQGHRKIGAPASLGAPASDGPHRMKRLVRLLRIAGLAALIVYAVYAPIYAYNRGHLAGYREGVSETITRIVKAWPLIPMSERGSRPL